MAEGDLQRLCVRLIIKKPKELMGDVGNSYCVQLFAIVYDSFRQEMNQMPETIFNSNDL